MWGVSHLIVNLVWGHCTKQSKVQNLKITIMEADPKMRIVWTNAIGWYFNKQHCPIHPMKVLSPCYVPELRPPPVRPRRLPLSIIGQREPRVTNHRQGILWISLGQSETPTDIANLQEGRLDNECRHCWGLLCLVDLLSSTNLWSLHICGCHHKSETYCRKFAGH